MKYRHTVKQNGVVYAPGKDVPDIIQAGEVDYELASLKHEADERGINYHWNIGISRLRQLIEEHDRSK